MLRRGVVQATPELGHAVHAEVHGLRPGRESISSGGDGADMDIRGQEWPASNPHMKFYNQRRGYVRCQLDRRVWRTDYQGRPARLRSGADEDVVAEANHLDLPAVGRGLRETVVVPATTVSLKL